MGANLNTAVVGASTASYSTAAWDWRKEQTKNAVFAILNGRTPNLDGFRIVPSNDCDRFVFAFSTFSLLNTVSFLRSLNGESMKTIVEHNDAVNRVDEVLRRKEDVLGRTEFALGKKVEALRALILQLGAQYPNGVGVPKYMTEQKANLTKDIAEIKVKVEGIKKTICEIENTIDKKVTRTDGIYDLIKARETLIDSLLWILEERKTPVNEIKTAGFEEISTDLLVKQAEAIEPRKVAKKEVFEAVGDAGIEALLSEGVLSVPSLNKVFTALKKGAVTRFFVKEVVTA